MSLPRSIRQLLLCLLLLLSCSEVWGYHFMGAMISYECISSCTYSIKHATYYDCTGTSPQPPNVPFEPIITWNEFPSTCTTVPSPISTWSLAHYIEVTPICPQIQSACTDPLSPINGAREAIYTRDYDLCIQGAYPCTQMKIGWENCCRNLAITSGPDYTFIFVYSTIDLTVSPCNSSPEFLGESIIYLCTGIPYTYDPRACDPEGDSLNFSLVNCQKSASAGVDYDPFFSASQPLGPEWNLQILQKNGEIIFTPTLGSAVVGIVCILVEEFRNGVKIGEQHREIQVSALNCAGNTSLPTFQDPIDHFGGRKNRPWIYEVCVGNTLRLKIPVTDPDTSQKLSVFNITKNLPVTIISDSTNPDTIQILYTPLYGGIHTLNIRATDNQCPFLLYQDRTIWVIARNNCLTSQITDAACGLATGAIDLHISGFTPPIRFQWSNGDTTEDLTNVLPGVYSVTVSDSLGYFAADTFFINASNIQINPSIVQPTCNFPFGWILTNPSGGMSPYHFQWSTGDTTSSLNAITVGVYQLLVTDANGCPFQKDLYLNEPDSCFDIVGGIVFNDDNNNCRQDSGEYGRPNLLVDITPGGATVTDSLGRYSLPADSGNYQITLYPPATQSITCPTSGTYQYNSGRTQTRVDTLDFGTKFYAQHDLRVRYTMGRPVVGRPQTHNLWVINDGGQTISGGLHWIHDSIFSYQNSSPSGSYNIAQRRLNWPFSNLLPGGSLHFQVTTSVKTSTSTGTPFKNKAGVHPIARDTTPLNNFIDLLGNATASFDPNKKYVNPVGKKEKGYIHQSEQLMHYLIRFQNTGSDTAYQVIIRDTLDPNLDYTSLTPDGSSHLNSLTLENDSILVFVFNNIQLPDSSTNFLASQGFVQYFIRHKGLLPSGTQIKNHAAIYFDFNEEVITNETLNTIYTYPELEAADSTVFCEGELYTAKLKNPGVPPYSFEWSNGIKDTMNMSGMHSIPISQSGWYEVTVTDYLGSKDSLRELIQVKQPPIAFFVLNQDSLHIKTTAASTPNTFWYWDFGDGIKDSSGFKVEHTYGSHGNFLVTLIAGNSCGTDTLVIPVHFQGVGIIDSRNPMSVSLVPHPLEEVSLLTFDNPEHQAFQFSLYDLQGKLVRSQGPSREDFFELKRENLPSGVYLYELKGKQAYYGRLLIR